MSVLDVVLIVLALVGVWAIVELALTLRRTRSSLVEVVDSTNATIEQVQPIISKLDGMMDELEPAIKKIDPLLDNANESIEGIPALVTSCTTILDDVNTVTGVASTATNAVSKAATNAVSSVSGVFSRIGSRKKGAAARISEVSADSELESEEGSPIVDGLVSEPETEAETVPEPAPEPEPVAQKSTGYVVYGAKKAAEAEEASEEVSA